MKKLLIIFVSIFSVIEVSADTIDSNKEIDLYALSQKYPRCTNSSYRDECYKDYHNNELFLKRI